ncbi:MarR family winged helix-turn-helix transcriptional regulator [Rhodobacter sp. NSM]|uniref:MarR family winged helix-turn-helix transcriptional regulator n=1 Tax=Rhodobacter sp. NSM TaxID=3457501 RepID=UPI003FD3C43C
MKTDTDRLGLLLHDATRAIRKRFERQTSHLGLSTAQWRLLAQLSREPRATQARLADLLDIEPISVSRLIDRMELGGWVRREADPCDRRARLVAPTEKTQAAYATIKAIADEVYDEALEGIPADRRGDLVSMLRTIVTNLNDAEAEDRHPCIKVSR